MIKRNGKDIYFYDEVNKDTILQLILEFEDATKDNKELFLHINSTGGECESALAFYDYLKEYKIPVWGIVEGLCASSAFIIFLGCDVREMRPHSQIMTHEISAAFEGYQPVSIIRGNMKGDAFLIKCEKEIIESETKIKDAFKMLGTDRFLTPKECKKLGITGFQKSFHKKIKKVLTYVNGCDNIEIR